MKKMERKIKQVAKVLYEKQDWITSPSYGWRANSVEEMERKIKKYLRQYLSSTLVELEME